LSWLREEGVAGELEVTHPGPVAFVALDGVLLGYVGLLDPPRPEAAEALAQLRALGLKRVVLLTGDRAPIARAVAEGLGLDDVVAEVLPEQKLEAIRAEQAAGRRVLMVGDGVNDTLALSQAEVGVAFGARVSEITLGGSDVAVLGSDLRLLPRMVELAALTRRTIDQNVAIGLLFSVGMLGLASGGWIGPLPGALLHNLGAVLVVANGARLLRRASR
jgi:P-type E1-E2 ATPase